MGEMEEAKEMEEAEEDELHELSPRSLRNKRICYFMPTDSFNILRTDVSASERKTSPNAPNPALESEFIHKEQIQKVRCIAKTKRNIQCKKMVSTDSNNPGNLCFVHFKMINKK